jgi:hypothetical protein
VGLDDEHYLRMAEFEREKKRKRSSKWLSSPLPKLPKDKPFSFQQAAPLPKAEPGVSVKYSKAKTLEALAWLLLIPLMPPSLWVIYQVGRRLLQ